MIAPLRNCGCYVAFQMAELASPRTLLIIISGYLTRSTAVLT